MDVLEKFKDMIDSSTILERLGVEADSYFLSTLHRPENVEDYYNLSSILEGLGLIYKEFGKVVIAALHPRTAAAIKRLSINVPEGVNIISPLI
ncbi:MAG: hypothetical protein QMD21_01945 [Candidatus Thermoplasmatota archaeon]|nr:hypothetical protein [Candidatus Thermoplasmatota archaeon]